MRHLPCSTPMSVMSNRSKMERGRADRNAGKLPPIEKVLAGSCFVAIASYALSESAFTLTILSVTLLALVALFKKALS